MDVTTLLKMAELERKLNDRGIELRFDNVSPRVVEFARRTPGLAERFA